MKYIIILLVLVPFGCAAQNYNIVLRGELHTDDIQLKITECKSGEIYELGPMASTQYILFLNEVDDLKEKESDQIIVEILGEPKQILNSVGTVVLGSWIEIEKILKIERGNCNEGAAYDTG